MSTPALPSIAIRNVAVAVIIARRARHPPAAAGDGTRDAASGPFHRDMLIVASRSSARPSARCARNSACPLRLTHLLGVYSEPGNPVVLIVYTGDDIRTTRRRRSRQKRSVAIGYFRPDVLPPLAFDHDAAIIADWQAFVA